MSRKAYGPLSQKLGALLSNAHHGLPLAQEFFTRFTRWCLRKFFHFLIPKFHAGLTDHSPAIRGGVSRGGGLAFRPCRGFHIGSYWLNPGWYDRVVLPEGYGILELSHFVIPLIGLWIAVRLVFDPFVRARPLMLTVSIIGALSCFYIAGEEMSWGQHFFHWNTPEYWAEVNRQQETNLHNTYAIFEKTPRSLLELGIAIGGLGVPLAAYFYLWLRAHRVSLFLPATALLPTAMGALFFKLVDRIQQSGAAKLLDRPSETIETYLYVFIIAYLVVYARRIRQLKTGGVHAAAATHVR